MTIADDLSGMPTTLPKAQIGLWNKVIRGFLSHSATTGPDLMALLAQAPDFALGHAIKGFSCLLLGRAEMFAIARADHATALKAPKGTQREMSIVAALTDWLDGHPSRAANRLQGVLAAHPRDALSMKLIQAIYFVMGNPRAMRASVEGLMPQWEDHAARGYLMGCYAFTLEETGDYVAAERIGRAGVDIATDDAWGLHAVTHVHDMTARAQDGLAFLSGRESSWSHCNNFRFHVWWHRALMHLDLQQYDAALDLYDRDIRAEKTDDYRDISNAASLLSRLELDGVCVGSRWDELADLSERRATDGCLAFADLHYLLALCGGERDEAAAGLIARMARARATDGEAQKIIAHPGLHLAKGLQSFAAGEYAAAWLHLREARSDAQSIGGSHAQRDIFARITIEAALRGGYMDAAEALLTDRAVQRANRQDGYTQRRLALIERARTKAI